MTKIISILSVMNFRELLNEFRRVRYETGELRDWSLLILEELQKRVREGQW